MRTEESYGAAATPALKPPTGLLLPQAPLLRSHNAPLVHSSARLPPRGQLRAQGLNKALNPGAQWADPHGMWRIPEPGSQQSLEIPSPGIRRPQVQRLQAAWTGGMAQFTVSLPHLFLSL